MLRQCGGSADRGDTRKSDNRPRGVVLMTHSRRSLRIRFCTCRPFPQLQDCPTCFRGKVIAHFRPQTWDLAEFKRLVTERIDVKADKPQIMAAIDSEDVPF